MADALPLPRHPEFTAELDELVRREPREAQAVARAIALLAAGGRTVGYPHSSAVRGGRLPGLRELRPRRGHSRYRVLYVLTDDEPVLLAIAHEAASDPRRFAQAVERARIRHAELTEGEDDACC